MCIWSLKKKKNAGLFQHIFGSNMDKPNRWFEFLNCTLNAMVEFVHIRPKHGLKHPSI